MQAPICEVCLNSDILCGGCAAKLESGELSEIEVEVSRFIYKLSDKVKSLKEAKLLRVIDSDILLLVARKGDGAKLVGKGGAVVKALAKKYGKSIRVLEENEFKPFVTELLQPLSVTGFNIVYTPEGEIYKVRVPASQKQKQHLSELGLAEIVKKIFGKKIELAFDNEL